jgi:N-acetylneuraminate synthase
MIKKIKIGDRIVGEKEPSFIIAEAGVNHNGRLDLAEKLVDVAVKSKADAVKFQTFKAEDLTTKKADSASYAEKNIGRKTKQIDLIKKIELEYEDFKKLKKYCDKKKIIFLSTPHSFDAIDFLEKLIPAYKIGSGDITNIPTLRHVAKKGKPIILGTGMSTIQEIKQAVKTIKKEGNNQIIALHCTTNYPCPIEDVNLNAMITMKKELDCLIGYSDHTLGTIVPIAATTLGACVLEKHFTIDRKLPGPDHKASLEPDELKNMVEQIREVEKALGSYDKKPTEREKKIMKLVRKSIVAKKDIKKGTTIKKDMLIIKRPGTGLKPNEIDKIIGMKTKRDIKKDEVLQQNMVG